MFQKAQHQSSTYNKVADYEGWQKEQNGHRAGRSHGVPQRLNPLATENPEHEHEGMPEILEIPPGNTIFTKLVRSIGVTKHLHSHHGKHVGDNSQYYGDITHRANTSRDCRYQFAHSLPRLGKIEHSKLE